VPTEATEEGRNGVFYRRWTGDPCAEILSEAKGAHCNELQAGGLRVGDQRFGGHPS
jgi:hypothetical protein